METIHELSLKAVRAYLEGLSTRDSLLAVRSERFANGLDVDRSLIAFPASDSPAAFVFHPKRRGDWMLALRLTFHQETTEEFSIRRSIGGIQRPVRWLMPDFFLLHTQQIEGLTPFLLERCWVDALMERYRNGFGRFMWDEPETLFNKLAPGYLNAVAEDSREFWNSNYRDVCHLVGDERIRFEISAHTDEWHAKAFREKECRAVLVALGCKDITRQAFEKHCRKLGVCFPDKG